jgi:hypothetical protein
VKNFTLCDGVMIYFGRAMPLLRRPISRATARFARRLASATLSECDLGKAYSPSNFWQAFACVVSSSAGAAPCDTNRNTAW